MNKEKYNKLTKETLDKFFEEVELEVKTQTFSVTSDLMVDLLLYINYNNIKLSLDEDKLEDIVVEFLERRFE
jgi:hypothetical protein